MIASCLLFSPYASMVLTSVEDNFTGSIIGVILLLKTPFSTNSRNATLYSIIQKDSNIRFDFALRLANELEIDVNEICSASPFSGAITEEEIYPTLPNGLNGALDGNRVKTYLKNSMYPLMYLFGKNSMPDVDNLLTSFYQLDDEARKEVVETIQFKLQYHRDPERAEQIKQIKGW